MMYLLVAALLSVLLINCQVVRYDSASLSGFELSEEQVDTIYEGAVYALLDTIVTAGQPGAICEIAASFAVGDPDHQCGADILKHVCGLNFDYTANLARITLADQQLEDHVTKFTGPVFDRFRGILIDCIKAASIAKVKEVGLSLASDAEAIAVVTSGEVASEVFGEAVGGAVAEQSANSIASADVIGVASKSAKSSVWARAVGFAACRGATSVIATSIDALYEEKGDLQLDSQCTSIKDWARDSRTWSSCTRSAGSLCALASLRGAVNVSNFLPTIESDSGKIIAQIGNAVATGGCLLGVNTTKLACSIISSAAGQIKMAIETGDNDWSRCLGVDRLGACVGYHWGSGGWTNISPVARAVNEGGLVYRPCCWCSRDYYVNDRILFSDTQIKTEQWLGVIQQGDVVSGNCRHMMRSSHDASSLLEGMKVYYRYSECRKAYILGDSCSSSEDGRFNVWDPDRKGWIEIKNIQ